ncbi:hypothetical protein FIBSPDRAFT_859491 [Athelia psychrophila]|uniref:Uncharacterized protein n=1 Tax=Athelia psychrophila TaxID=1759441 RepID=A0A166L031_9AGAM|nr:hypothetical protein FIBSPDRAFT_859491 [Fibularhizoctonia sp. CBS 109695]
MIQGDGEGFILYEIRATGRYITSKHASQVPSLTPTSDIKTAALFEQAEQAVFSELANFEGAAQVLCYEKWFQRFVPHPERWAQRIHR